MLGTADDLTGDVTTANGGYYLFNNLTEGEYVVSIPASNFAPGGKLNGYWSSGISMTSTGAIVEAAAAIADSDDDFDDNGTLTSGRVISSVVTLGPAVTTEPTGELDLDGTLPGNQQGQADAQANMTVDFGFYRVEIGNLVFLDANRNGYYDGAPEAGISGAVVRLYLSDGLEVPVGLDGILGTVGDGPGGMLTDGSGTYIFSGLPEGQYIVKTDSPVGLTSTIDTYDGDDTFSPAANTDNNDNGVGVGFNVVTSNTLNMVAGSTGNHNNNLITQATGTTRDITLDFGFVGMVALGNRIWLDDGAGGGISNNGIVDGGETSVASVTVRLYTSTGTFVIGTATNASGFYQFDNLIPGTYYVFIAPTEFQPGGRLESYYSSLGHGTDEILDENADENGIDDDNAATNGIRSIDYNLIPSTEISGEDQSDYTGTLSDNSVNFTADFGFTQKYSIGNRVWFDTNNDNDMDASEVGIDGITVNLYAAADLTTSLATTNTTDGGYYLFDGLYPGSYVVGIPVSNFNAGGSLEGYWSSGTRRTLAGVLSDVATALADSDDDIDDNGMLQSAGPMSGGVISSTITLGPSGDTEPTGETDLQAVIGYGEQTDGRANMTIDFGFYTMSLGNLVWGDTDKNGAFNGAEIGLGNLPVELWSGDGSTHIDMMVVNTNASGNYLFTGLAEGDYIVRVIAPANMASSIDSYSAADSIYPTSNIDNNDNGLGTGNGTVSSSPVTLTPGQVQNFNLVDDLDGSTFNPTMDFGFIPLFSLGNRVWYDTDNSGAIDGSEVGIEGVRVDLYAAADLTTILATQTTANGGYYLFNDLTAGDYVVSVAASNFSGSLTGYWSSGTYRTISGSLDETATTAANSDIDVDDNGRLQTSGALNGAVVSSVVTLGPAVTSEPTGELDLDGTLPGNRQGQPDAQANMTVDFGFYTMRLGNVVWNDMDNSGLLDGAETGIVGVTVELRTGDNLALLLTTTTDASGVLYYRRLACG